MTSITLPKSVTYIDSQAFQNCEKLTKVKVLTKTAEYNGLVFSTGFLDNQPATTVVLYGYEGSTTQAYAKEYVHTFIALEEPFILGDITGNGTVDISDSIALFQYAMLPDIYQISYEGNMDFSKDGVIDIVDAILLFRYSMLPDLYPIS